jgi:hypothetical protein
MLKKLYQSKRFEEILGILGLLYLLFLIFLTGFIVTFLVGASQNALTPSTIAGPSIPQYAIQKAESL